MSDPTRVSDTLPHVHRIVTPKFAQTDRGNVERYWSCRRCEGKGYVYETVALRVGEDARTYQHVARCRCAAGERMSPSMAVCSDDFWYQGKPTSGTAPPDDYPEEPDEAPPPAPEPTPWAGTIVEEIDP